MEKYNLSFDDEILPESSHMMKMYSSEKDTLEEGIHK